MPLDTVQEKKVSSPFAPQQWALLVAQIQADDPAGMEQLYRVFKRGIRYYFCRQVGSQELEDKVHDTFLIVVDAIRRGDIRQPERLMGFVRTIVRRQVAAHIESIVLDRRRGFIDVDVSDVPCIDTKENPEQAALIHEKTALVKAVLSRLCERDRELLTRFYLLEQTQEQICREMSLTATQFRLNKSRAKAKLGEIGQGKLKARRQHVGVCLGYRDGKPVISSESV